MKKLKKQDKVIVITGKDKGVQGEVLDVCYKNNKVKVKGVNLLTHFVKPRREGEVGGIQKREGYVHISNVLPVDAKTKKPVRVKSFVRD